MKARVLFGIVGFAFVLLTLYVLPPVIFALTIVALCVCATFELIVPTGLVRDRAMQMVSLTASAVYALTTCLPSALGVVLPAVPIGQAIALLVLCGLFTCLLRRHDVIHVTDVMSAAFAALILPYFLLSLWRIFHQPGGQFFVLLPMVAAWGSDTCALFTGMAFGRHKLAPVISPKKTIEGAIGGVIGATILMLLVVFLFGRYARLEVHYLSATIMGAAGAVIGQIGDLSFSIIKRQTGIKDYGHIFPGHGGVLDRFDSVIFVAPVIELILTLFGTMV